MTLARVFLLFTLTATQLMHAVEDEDRFFIATGEGSAISNSVDILAQWRRGGIVWLDQTTTANYASDLGDSDYAPHYHMGPVSIPGLPRQGITAAVNMQQQGVRFSEIEGKSVVSIPAVSAALNDVAAAFGDPLELRASKAVDFSDHASITDFEAAVLKVVSVKRPSITSVRVTIWQQEEAFGYVRTTSAPKFGSSLAAPTLSAYGALLQQCDKCPEVVWLVQVLESSVAISTTTVQLKRSQMALLDVLKAIDVTNANFDGYPSKEARVRDACRELRRRLLINRTETMDALKESMALSKLIKSIDEPGFRHSAYQLIHFLFSSRIPELTDLLMSEVRTAPTAIANEVYFNAIPGIYGNGPEWENMFKPVWNQLLTSSDGDLVRRAKAMLRIR